MPICYELENLVERYHICYYTSGNFDRITLHEIVESHYKHSEGIIQIYETIVMGDYHRSDIQASVLILMEAMQKTVKQLFSLKVGYG